MIKSFLKFNESLSLSTAKDLNIRMSSFHKIVEKITLPFTEIDYNKFIHNLNPKKYGKYGEINHGFDTQYQINGSSSWYEIRSDHEYLKILKYLLDFDNNLSVCDIGCGLGNVLYFAKELGFKKCLGVEYLKKLENFHKKLGLDVKYGDVLKMDLSFLAGFDVIYLYRPIADDRLMNSLVLKIKENMKDGAILIYYHIDELSISHLDKFVEFFDSDGYYMIKGIETKSKIKYEESKKKLKRMLEEMGKKIDFQLIENELEIKKVLKKYWNCLNFDPSLVDIEFLIKCNMFDEDFEDLIEIISKKSKNNKKVRFEFESFDSLRNTKKENRYIFFWIWI